FALLEQRHDFSRGEGELPALPDDAAVQLGTSEDYRATDDPDGAVLGSPQSQQLKVWTRRGGVSARWMRAAWSAILRGDSAHSAVQGKTALRRVADAGYVGATLRPHTDLIVEGKALARVHTDDKPAGAANDDPTLDAGTARFTHRRRSASGYDL